MIFSQQNLTASPHIIGSDPLAIPVKKGEKFSFEAAFEGEYYVEGEQSKTVSILLILFMFWISVVSMVLKLCWLWFMFG